VEKVWGLAVKVRTECGNSGQGHGWKVIKNMSTKNKFITEMGWGNEETLIIEGTQEREMTRRRGT
jgi:hypothetical protein